MTDTDSVTELTRYTVVAGLWFGPYAVERRVYVVLAESRFWALYTVVQWALAPKRAGRAGPSNVTSLRIT